MLYIIGGAPRGGKTLLSRRFMQARRVPYFSTDALIWTLSHANPKSGISHKLPIVTKSEKLWPIAKHLLTFFAYVEDSYTVEGDVILPRHVKELQDENKNVLACFFGYPSITPEEKLHLVRIHARKEKDWTNNIDDASLLYTFRQAIEFSRYLKHECEKLLFPFFDLSADFDAANNEAFEFLMSTLQ